MTSAQIFITIFNTFKNKKMYYWFGLLVFSSFGPLLTTYIFSRGVYALETSQGLDAIILIFVAYLTVSVSEVLIRVAGKTRVHYYVEASVVQLQQKFLKTVKVRSKFRKRTVQSIRNLTQSIRTFSTYFINNGVAGIVSFVSVPFILFFIDIRVFWVEMALIFVYMTATYFYSRAYEKKYEKYDESRELYFTKMTSSNKVQAGGRRITKNMMQLQNLRFFEWFSLQNIIIISQVLIILIISVDIVNGFRGIADLVLVVGYTKESQKFLNSITSDLNRIMQIRAGVERLAVNSSGGKSGSVMSLN